MIASLGHTARRFTRSGSERIRFAGAVLRSVPSVPDRARPVLLRVTINQIRFTAVDAVPLIVLVGTLVGITVVVQANLQTAALLGDTLGRVVAVVVVRELGPLITAVLILGRSGTAIAAELATVSALGERDALEASGVDPNQYYVVPRVVAALFSGAILTIVFLAAALLLSGGLAALAGWVHPAAYFDSLQLAVLPSDVAWAILKGALFAGGIALFCCHAGLFAGDRATAIPQAVTRGMVASMVFVFAVSAILSVALYA